MNKKEYEKLTKELRESIDRKMNELTKEEESTMVTKSVTIMIKFTQEQIKKIGEISIEMDTNDEELISFIATSGLLSNIEDDDFMEQVRDKFFSDSLGLDY